MLLRNLLKNGVLCRLSVRARQFSDMPPPGWEVYVTEGEEIAKNLPAFASFGDRLVGSFNSMKCEFRRPISRANDKSMHLSASWFRLLLPFSTERKLREKYVMFDTTEIRNGKIMEVIDALAGDAAIRYIRLSLENGDLFLEVFSFCLFFGMIFFFSQLSRSFRSNEGEFCAV